MIICPEYGNSQDVFGESVELFVVLGFRNILGMANNVALTASQKRI
jgi:hypothetical protein